jgi:hypothetical protein
MMRDRGRRIPKSKLLERQSSRYAGRRVISEIQDIETRRTTSIAHFGNSPGMPWVDRRSLAPRNLSCMNARRQRRFDLKTPILKVETITDLLHIRIDFVSYSHENPAASSHFIPAGHSRYYRVGIKSQICERSKIIPL